jgi:hypothetical protein
VVVIEGNVKRTGKKVVKSVSAEKDLDVGRVVTRDVVIEDDVVWEFGNKGVVRLRFGISGENPAEDPYIEQALVYANNYIKTWCSGHCVKIPLADAIPEELRLILDNVAESEALAILYTDSQSYSGTDAKATHYEKMVNNELTNLLNYLNGNCNGGEISPYTITTSSKFTHSNDYSCCVKSTNRSFVGCCSSFRDN